MSKAKTAPRLLPGGQPLKAYTGRVPPCGVFCGGCPNYLRERNPCPGAQLSRRCALKACRFYTCSQEKGIAHCCQCREYPCPRFKRFARNWVKYGQDFFINQADLRTLGEQACLETWNARADGRCPGTHG